MNTIDFLSNYPEKDFIHYLNQPDTDSFTHDYLQIRQIEGRVYSNEIVMQLPNMSNDHIQFNEWVYRKYSSDLLLNYLSTKKYSDLLDLGCGNGWFTNKLSKVSTAYTIGLDINEYELKQAGQLFTSPRCHFAYGDIFQNTLPENHFDVIVMNSSIQYFPSLSVLLDRLLTLIRADGELHILDSPLYKNKTEADQASMRSRSYFESIGFGGTSYYYHHSLETLKKFNCRFLYNPESIPSKINSLFFRKKSPFPWICIKK